MSAAVLKATYIKALFVEADLNKDGYISKEEMNALLVELDATKWSTDKLDALFEQFDVDLDGRLKYEEFIDWCLTAKEIANDAQDPVTSDDVMQQALQEEIKEESKETDTLERETSAEGQDIRITVSILRVSGESQDIQIPERVNASQLRSHVAKAAGIPILETLLIDNETGTRIYFADAKPMEPVPTNLMLLRSKAWAMIPEGMHHDEMKVSEDRSQIQHSDKESQNEGCFLSAPLERGGCYRLTYILEGDRNTGLYVGVTPDRMTHWPYLDGCFFQDPTGISDTLFHGGESPEVYDESKYMLATYGPERNSANPAKLSMRLDTHQGIIELFNSGEELLVRHRLRDLAEEESLRFCASFFRKGMKLTIVDSVAE